MKSTYTLAHSLNPSFEVVIKHIYQVTSQLKIPFFIAGATARDIIIHHVFGRNPGRRTFDIDTAIFVSSWEEFNQVKSALLSFEIEETNIAHRLRHKQSGLPIDIIPFGEVSDADGNITWPPEHDITMSVAGFEEAFNAALLVKVSEGIQIHVASLPGLALLKLIAWNERKSETRKDAQDFFNIMQHYTHINGDRLWDEVIPSEALNYKPERQAAYLLGLDMVTLLTNKPYPQLSAIKTDFDQQFKEAITRQSSLTDATEIVQLVDDFWQGLERGAACE